MTEAENLSKRYGEKLAVNGRGFVAQPASFSVWDPSRRPAIPGHRRMA